MELFVQSVIYWIIFNKTRRQVMAIFSLRMMSLVICKYFTILFNHQLLLIYYSGIIKII